MDGIHFSMPPSRCLDDWQRFIQSKSTRAKVNEKLTSPFKAFWLKLGGVCDYRKVHSDLREHCEHCGMNRVYRLVKKSELKAQVVYRKPRNKGGQAHIVTSP